MAIRKSWKHGVPHGSVELIEQKIYLIRRHKVMIDFDLSQLYEVPTKRLNEQVRRNPKRFPKDFMFRLTKTEAEALRSQFAISNSTQGALRSQFATSKTGRGGRRYLPHVFTEQGVAMPVMSASSPVRIVSSAAHNGAAYAEGVR